MNIELKSKRILFEKQTGREWICSTCGKRTDTLYVWKHEEFPYIGLRFCPICFKKLDDCNENKDKYPYSAVKSLLEDLVANNTDVDFGTDYKGIAKDVLELLKTFENKKKTIKGV